jgi:ABC-type sugar transport system substrate-binding protein
MSANPPTPLSPRERAALDRLEQWVEGRDDAKAREAVITHLTDGDFDRAEAERLLDNLLSKGYCYELEGIHVTNAE